MCTRSWVRCRVLLTSKMTIKEIQEHIFICFEFSPGCYQIDMVYVGSYTSPFMMKFTAYVYIFTDIDTVE